MNCAKILVAISLFTTSAYAVDDDVVVVKKPEAKKEEPVKPAVKKTDADVVVVPADKYTPPPPINQEEYRSSKKVMATVQLLGGGPSWTWGPGITAGAFLNQDMILFFEATNGKNYNFLDELFEDTDAKSRSIGVHFKHFVKNTFYYRAGVDYRTLDYRQTSSRFSTTPPYYMHGFKGESAAVTVAIGNQWQMKNFTFGLDWIGLSIPISEKYSNEFALDDNGAPSTLEQQELQSDKKRQVEDSALNFLRLYLGASF